ncbi:streptomycin 3-adenylyltransferase [Bacillus oleivorans]|uniref:Spectinomycin 9-adenylyltransferase n=1 Tax=Bacillus oleivorans TaxID=1448271 RepID=A0A285CI62_9BACI|nr:aminoglycoside adenylyltransferase domain-containing protein [Bacillus oleivorans]SNX67292.1 streptomycin 3-adenylyltransferase [Bacillus oleivorans]
MIEIQATLNQVCHVFKQHLQDQLTGIYLHGSLAMGCFHPLTSDIDLLIVVSEPLSFSAKQAIVRELVSLTPIYPGKGVEMSIILEKDAAEPLYPMPFELHYGTEWGERFLLDTMDLCEGGTDPDLSAHIAVTIERGKCLYGKAISDVFAPISSENYCKSIYYDVKDAKDGILQDPVYTILNLCRTLQYVRERKILSKKEGGEWGLTNLSDRDKPLVQLALGAYGNGVKHFTYNDEQLLRFAGDLLEEISIGIQDIR